MIYLSALYFVHFKKIKPEQRNQFYPTDINFSSNFDILYVHLFQFIGIKELKEMKEIMVYKNTLRI